MNEGELIERLEKLERANRRLKQCGVAGAVLIVALTAIYATRPAPQKVTAHELDIVDSRGNVRIRLGVIAGDTASVAVFDLRGRRAAEMFASGSGAFSEGEILVRDPDTSNAAVIYVDGGLPSIWLTGNDGSEQFMRGNRISVSGKSPSIMLSDPQGFEMDLGSTGTVSERTGETQRTSAASIVMFGNGKDHHVIWRAP